MNFLWIDTPSALSAALPASPSRIGLDTEFIRERTCWPILALVQVAVDGEIFLLDARAEGMQQAIAGLLALPAPKIMHSPSEDLVAFWHTCRTLPAPLFDTQTAAALCGLGSGLGYQRLVQALLGIELEKGEQRSDWLRRPLSASQQHYAAADVAHLFALHDVLHTRLDALGRTAWLAEESERALRTATAEPERWPHREVRMAQQFDRPAQQRLLRLLRWREHTARERDLPRSWLIEPLLACQLAEQPPQSLDALDALLARTPKAARKLAPAIWQALHTALPDEALMPAVRRDDQLDKPRLRRLQQAVAKVAVALDIPEGLLASKRWLIALMEGDGHWPAALQGWRQSVLQEALEPLL